MFFARLFFLAILSIPLHLEMAISAFLFFENSYAAYQPHERLDRQLFRLSIRWNQGGGRSAGGGGQRRMD